MPGCNSSHYITTQHNAQVHGGVKMTYERTVYTLQEIEFHTPSEHAFDGLRTDMEVQFKMDKSGCVPGGCSTKSQKLHLSILFQQVESSIEAHAVF